MTRQRLLIGLWAGVIGFLAGRLLDLRWHTTHEEFETAADQLQAHWLAWLGARVLLVAAAGAWRSRPQLRTAATPAILVGGSATPWSPPGTSGSTASTGKAR